jgi:hypothetical protein
VSKGQPKADVQPRGPFGELRPNYRRKEDDDHAALDCQV